MKRKFIVIIYVLLFTFCTSCDSFDSENSKLSSKSELVLGFSQLGSESAWRTGNSLSIQQAAEKAGIQLMFNNAQQKQENQIKAIRSFIAYQVDVIAFAPIVEDGWDNVLSEAKEANIPVLLCDRYIKTDDETLFAGFIGSDFVEEGRRAARFLNDRAKNMEQPINIVEITGTEGSSPMKGRYDGFREALDPNIKYEILCSMSADFLRSKGKQSMEYILEKYKDIDVLYTHNDSMTLGAIDAIKAAGLKPGQDIIIISVDGEQAIIDAIKNGEVNCVVECTPHMGDKVMDLTKKLASGESIPRNTYNEETVFTDSDDLSDLPPRGY